MKSRSKPRTWWPTERLACGSFAVALAACSTPLGPETDALAAARAAWASGAPSGYTYELQRSCFCGSEFLRQVRIQVDDGAVISAVFVDDGSPITTPLDAVPTVDDLFAEIQDAIDREAHQILATYDATLGYPTDVAIDFILEAIDEESAFQVSGFENGLGIPGSR